MVDAETGTVRGLVDAVELVTVGQRRGFGHGSDGRRQYVLDVDVPARRVAVGSAEQVMTDRVSLSSLTFTDRPVVPGERVVAQVSAHGRPIAATFLGDALQFAEPQRLVAPGQTVAFYDPEHLEVVWGAGLVDR